MEYVVDFITWKSKFMKLFRILKYVCMLKLKGVQFGESELTCDKVKLFGVEDRRAEQT